MTLPWLVVVFGAVFALLTGYCIGRAHQDCQGDWNHLTRERRRRSDYLRVKVH